MLAFNLFSEHNILSYFKYFFVSYVVEKNTLFIFVKRSVF
jgi:hypothetical protein